MRNPEIITKGRDPNCVHWENIVGYIGKYRKCGQVRDYSVCEPVQDLPVTPKEYCQAARKRKAVAA